MSPPKAAETMVVQLSVGQLQEIVTRAVAQALDARDAQQPAPALLSLKKICAALDVSERAMLDLRKEGLPHRMVGDSPKFVLSDVMAWLETRDASIVQANFDRLLKECAPPDWSGLEPRQRVLARHDWLFALADEAGLRVGMKISHQGGWLERTRPKKA